PIGVGVIIIAVAAIVRPRGERADRSAADEAGGCPGSDRAAIVPSAATPALRLGLRGRTDDERPGRNSGKGACFQPVRHGSTSLTRRGRNRWTPSAALANHQVETNPADGMPPPQPTRHSISSRMGAYASAIHR